jgi:hypothetical protein
VEERQVGDLIDVERKQPIALLSRYGHKDLLASSKNSQPTPQSTSKETQEQVFAANIKTPSMNTRRALLEQELLKRSIAQHTLETVADSAKDWKSVTHDDFSHSGFTSKQLGTCKFIKMQTCHQGKPLPSLILRSAFGPTLPRKRLVIKFDARHDNLLDKFKGLVPNGRTKQRSS